jgi:hypothetical protein
MLPSLQVVAVAWSSLQVMSILDWVRCCVVSCVGVHSVASSRRCELWSAEARRADELLNRLDSTRLDSPRLTSPEHCIERTTQQRAHHQTIAHHTRHTSHHFVCVTIDHRHVE